MTGHDQSLTDTMNEDEATETETPEQLGGSESDVDVSEDAPEDQNEFPAYRLAAQWHQNNTILEKTDTMLLNPFTDAELADRARGVAELAAEIQDAEEARKYAATQAKEAIQDLEGKQREAMTEIREGGVFVSVPVEIIRDHDAATLYFVRTDTEMVYQTQPMTDHEREHPPLPGVHDAPEPPEDEPCASWIAFDESDSATHPGEGVRVDLLCSDDNAEDGETVLTDWQYIPGEGWAGDGIGPIDPQPEVDFWRPAASTVDAPAPGEDETEGTVL